MRSGRAMRPIYHEPGRGTSGFIYSSLTLVNPSHSANPPAGAIQGRYHNRLL